MVPDFEIVESTKSKVVIDDTYKFVISKIAKSIYQILFNKCSSTMNFELTGIYMHNQDHSKEDLRRGGS